MCSWNIKKLPGQFSSFLTKSLPSLGVSKNDGKKSILERMIPSSYLSQGQNVMEVLKSGYQNYKDTGAVQSMKQSKNILLEKNPGVLTKIGDFMTPIIGLAAAIPNPLSPYLAAVSAALPLAGRLGDEVLGDIKDFRNRKKVKLTDFELTN